MASETALVVIVLVSNRCRLLATGSTVSVMKINRHGRAKVLTQSEIQQIFAHGLSTDRDRALFAVCLFSACRIREAVTLQTQDIYTPKGQVRSQLIIRKANRGEMSNRTETYAKAKTPAT